MSSNRREFMRKMGAVGASVGAVSIAGCSGQNNESGGGDGGGGSNTTTVEKEQQEGLPEDRKIQTLEHMSNTERYWAERYQANVLIDKWLRDKIGLPVETKPMEFTVITQREEAGDYGFVTYNWCALAGDPDSILVDRFRSDGNRNYTNFNNSKYDELVTKQRKETDTETRKEMVFEAQKILGEQRPEHQYLYNEYPYAYNNERFEEDSIVVDVNGFKNIWNYTQIVPKNDNGKTIVSNNWDPTDLLNPLHHNTTGPDRNYTPMSFMHDFLVRTGPDLQAKPWAAEKWEWKDDVTNEVTLKSGMKFHDGEDVTIEDVAFSFNISIDKDVPAYKVFVNDVIDSLEVTGDRTIEFTLKQPYTPFVPVTLGSVPILPKHYWEELMEETGSSDRPWEIAFGDDRPIIASGPFQYGSWDQGSRFELPAFKDHSFAVPNIDKRVQRPLDTRDAELEALKNGDYDLLDYWFGSPSKLREEVTADDKLTLVQVKDDCRQAMWNNVERRPLDDVAMRQAINAVVMEANTVIIEEIYDGFGEEAPSPINPTLAFWHNPDTPWFEGGVNGATTILKDAGYEWDTDDNLYYPEG